MKNLSQIIEICTWLNINLKKIKQIFSSNNNQVFDLWDCILKISEKSHNLKNEFDILQKLKWKYFPKALFYFKNGEKYYLIISKLNWKTLDNFWLNYNENKQQGILKNITENLKIVHSIWDEKNENYFVFLEQKLQKIKEKVMQNSLVDKQNLESLENIFLNNKNCFIWEVNVLVHNDLWYRNILATKNEFIWIIDFEESIFAPKQVELFKLFNHLQSAKNYFDTNPIEYKELDFLNKFLTYLRENYKELFNYTKEQKLIYDIVSYFSMLSKWEENWYNHKEIEKFYKENLDF